MPKVVRTDPTPDETALAADALEALEERRRKVREAETRLWLESEAAELRDSVKGDPDKLAAVLRTLAKAKSEGRYYDDTAATYANIRARVPADRVVFTRADVALLLALGSWMDEEAGPVSQPTGPTAAGFRQAAQNWIQALIVAGQMASAETIGAVVQEEIPAWAMRNPTVVFQNGKVVPADDAMVPAGMPVFQRRAWQAIESAWRPMLKAIRDGGTPPLSGSVPRWQPWGIDTDGKYGWVPETPPASVAKRMRELAGQASE